MDTATETPSRLAAVKTALAAVPAWLVGPIFTKELRVSSRRRRNYVLRALYVAGLIAFVALVWMSSVRWEYGSAAFRASRMSIAGKQIIFTVVWFQFIVAQLVTIVMMSTSISEEVYLRTLGVLMTTPINSFQIVVGKLLSKMLQLIMLLATSLPVLAAVRVLGGVPWSYVLAGLLLTLTTALLCAAVTMLYSILFRRAFVSILLSLATVAALYGGVPLIVALAVEALDLDRIASWAALFWALVHYNPYATLTVSTEALFQPGMAARGMMGWQFVWWGCCVFSVVVSGALLALCVALVRRVGLRLAAGATGAGASSAAEIAVASAPPAPVLQPASAAAGAPEPPPVVAVTAARAVPANAGKPPRPITGSPIVWREIRSQWTRRRWLFWLLFGIGAGLLLLIYGLLAVDNDLDDDEVHAAFLCIYTLIAAVAIAVLSATNITSEKEAKSWEILLATPLSGWHILAGKAAGILRRALPTWILPIGHVLVFMAVGYVHPVLLPHMLLVLFSITVLFAGSGLWFGTRFRRTSTAVILNLAVGVGLWLVLPGLLFLTAEALPYGTGSRRDLQEIAELTGDVNPVVQSVLLSEKVSGDYKAARELRDFDYHWPAANKLNVYETTAYLMAISAGYFAVAALLAWLARRRMRKRVF